MTAITNFIKSLVLIAVLIIISALGYSLYKASQAPEADNVPYEQQPPQFDMGKIGQLLEIATDSQTVAVTLDTIVVVQKRTFNLLLKYAGRIFNGKYQGKIWTSDVKARTITKFVFKLKAGFTGLNIVAKYNNFIAIVPQPVILTCETVIDRTQDLSPVTDVDIWFNQNFIKKMFWYELEQKAKKLALKKAESGLLESCRTFGKAKLENELKFDVYIQ